VNNRDATAGASDRKDASASGVPAGPEATEAFRVLDEQLVRAGARMRAQSRVSDRWDSAWRRHVVSIGFALSVVIIAAAASYAGGRLAYEQSAAHTDARIAVLEGDLSQRRAASMAANRIRDAQAAQRDAQIAELRRLVCAFADHAQPQDADIQQIRAQYHCP
jgi:hypothetical protein